MQAAALNAALNGHLYAALMLLLVASSIADVYTTLMCLKSGTGTEGNPFVRLSMRLAGDVKTGLILVKLALIVYAHEKLAGTPPEAYLEPLLWAVGISAAVSVANYKIWRRRGHG